MQNQTLFKFKVTPHQKIQLNMMGIKISVIICTNSIKTKLIWDFLDSAWKLNIIRVQCYAPREHSCFNEMRKKSHTDTDNLCFFYHLQLKSAKALQGTNAQSNSVTNPKISHHSIGKPSIILL